MASPTDAAPAEQFQEIPTDHIWKPPEFERRLPELFAKARSGPQLFKVWKGDIPRCEIETKGSLQITRVQPPEGSDATTLELWDFQLEHRAGTNFWPVLDPLVRHLGQPMILTMTGEARVYQLSGDPVRPFAGLRLLWALDSTPGPESAAAAQQRVAVRDQVLDAAVGHLKRRDKYFADVLERLVGVVRANDTRIEESGLSNDIEAFAAMEMTPGKALKPSIPLRSAKIKIITATGFLHSFAHDNPELSDGEVAQATWRECFDRHEDLASKDLQWVLRRKKTGDKALRLGFLATRSSRSSQEPFKDFRRQMNRQKLRPHPWIVRDSNP